MFFRSYLLARQDLAVKDRMATFVVPWARARSDLYGVGEAKVRLALFFDTHGTSSIIMIDAICSSCIYIYVLYSLHAHRYNTNTVDPYSQFWILIIVISKVSKDLHDTHSGPVCTLEYREFASDFHN